MKSKSWKSSDDMSESDNEDDVKVEYEEDEVPAIESNI